MKDEFFVDEAPAALLTDPDVLAVPQRVVRKIKFDELAVALTEALLMESSSLESYVRIKN